MPNRSSRRSRLEKIVGQRRPPIEDELDDDVEMKTPAMYKFRELADAGIEIQEELDHGTYARVYRAIVRDVDAYGTQHVAVKRQYIQTEANKYEIEILHQLGSSSRYIPELLDVLHDEECRVYSLVLPYYEHVPFTECMKSMPLKEFQEYARHLFLSLDELHKQGFVHRDVKPGNFLYVKGRTPQENQYVLLDFGLAERIDHLHHASKKYAEVKQQRARTCRVRKDHCGQFVTNIFNETDHKADRQGTRGFRPPEVLMGSYFQDETLDIWAAGVILAAIVTNSYALFGAPEDDARALLNLATVFGDCALVNTATDLKVSLDFHIRETIDCDFDALGLENFLKGLCTKPEYLECQQLFDMLYLVFDLKPMRRPTAEQILRHPFFRLHL